LTLSALVWLNKAHNTNFTFYAITT
jgi:hypothetical protein